MEIILEDKFYYKIVNYCEHNHFEINEYIEDCIAKQFNIDRYGDLNQLVNPQNEIENCVVEVKLDESKDNIVVRLSQAKDIVIPIITIPELTLKGKEVSTKVKQQKENEIPTIKTFKEKEEQEEIHKPRKRVLKTK